MRMWVQSLASLSGCGCGIGGCNSTPGLGTSICCRCSPKKKKKFFFIIVDLDLAIYNVNKDIHMLLYHVKNDFYNYFNIIGFLHNHEYFILCIRKYYSEQG